MASKSNQAGWRQWTEDEARAALEDLARSGMSAARYAKSKGFSTQRLIYWRKRLGDVSRPAFVSVALPISSSARSQIEISTGSVTVRLRDDVEIARLVELVKALAGRGPEC